MRMGMEVSPFAAWNAAALKPGGPTRVAGLLEEPKPSRQAQEILVEPAIGIGVVIDRDAIAPWFGQPDTDMRHRRFRRNRQPGETREPDRRA